MDWDLIVTCHQIDLVMDMRDGISVWDDRGV
jgi:hypothetical protein